MGEKCFYITYYLHLLWSCRVVEVHLAVSLHTIQSDGTDDFPPGSTQWAVNIFWWVKESMKLSHSQWHSLNPQINNIYYLQLEFW